MFLQRPWFGFLLVVFLGQTAVLGQLPVAPVAVEEVQTVVGARNALDQFFAIPIESVPPKMLSIAEGVAIFPNMIKGGFILGVNYGRGVLHVRKPDRTWSNPVMISMGGGSIGFQAGVQAADVVLVFATPRSLEGILNGQKITLGADASVAMGPVGVQTNAGTDARLGAEIYSYARSRGLFLGVSLGGADLAVDHNADSMLYGRFGTTPRDVFTGQGLAIRPEVQQLVDDLNAKSQVGIAQAPAIRLSAVPPEAPAVPLQAASPEPLKPVPLAQPPRAPPLPPEVVNPPLVPIPLVPSRP